MFNSTQEQEGFHLFMQQERNKIIAIQTFCWFLVAICMGIIFYFSSKTSTESSSQSGQFVSLFQKILGNNAITDFIVRKSAHCLEFAGLSFLLNIALFVQTNKIKPLFSILFTSLYAVTDEIHQIFVSGRSCQIKDWGIDTMGAIIGTLIFLTIYFIIVKIIKHKKSKQIDTIIN